MKDRVDEGRNAKNDGYQRRLASMVYKLFDRKTGLGAIKSVNEELGQELHEAMSKKIKRRRFSARFKNNIWVADMAGMGS